MAGNFGGLIFQIFTLPSLKLTNSLLAPKNGGFFFLGHGRGNESCPFKICKKSTRWAPTKLLFAWWLFFPLIWVLKIGFHWFPQISGMKIYKNIQTCHHSGNGSRNRLSNSAPKVCCISRAFFLIYIPANRHDRFSNLRNLINEHNIKSCLWFTSPPKTHKSAPWPCRINLPFPLMNLESWQVNPSENDLKRRRGGPSVTRWIFIGFLWQKTTKTYGVRSNKKILKQKILSKMNNP